MITPLFFKTLFPTERVFHAVFPRHGGLGKPPFHSLNVSMSVGDDAEVVEANRQLIKQTLGADRLISSRQVHGTTIHCIDAVPRTDRELPDGDALICTVPGVAIMVQQADCQAIMLYDPVRHVVANIHCGWRGSVANIIGATIERMCSSFGSLPAHLLAAVSPSLGPCCAEFIHYEQELPRHFYPFQGKPGFFDFWAISRMQLRDAGLVDTHIQCASICTVCDANWFSYRREGRTGRFCSVIGLAHTANGPAMGQE